MNAVFNRFTFLVITLVFLIQGKSVYARSECGTASYYDPAYAGLPTANGESFNPSAMTAAHQWLPMDTQVRVVDQETDTSIVVRINDRTGTSTPHIIDLTPAGMERIAPSLDVGIRRVCLHWETE